MKKFGFAGGMAGKGFYDNEKKEIEINDGDWGLSASAEKNGKLSLSKKNPFGVEKGFVACLGHEEKKFFGSGLYTCSAFSAFAKTNFAKTEIGVTSNVAGVDAACDLTLQGENFQYLVGASYKLPSSVPFSPHVGIASNDLPGSFTLGAFGNLDLPNTKKSTGGIALQMGGAQPNLLIGTNFVTPTGYDVKAKCAIPGAVDVANALIECSVTQDMGVKVSCGAKMCANNLNAIS